MCVSQGCTFQITDTHTVQHPPPKDIGEKCSHYHNIRSKEENNVFSLVRALATPFPSNDAPSAPIPSPSSSSPQHELPAVSAGLPVPASVSPGCAASPVRSASWAARTAATRRSRSRSAHSGPGAGPL